MTDLIPLYLLYPAAIIVAAAISMYAVKKILFITRHRKLYDMPDNIRKIHGANIPSLGGIGIFIGYIVAASFFIYQSWFYVVAASVILFFTGVYDDIMNMLPAKKLLAQLAASALAVYFAGIRLDDLHGIMGIHELPYGISVGLTVFCCTFFINVFNFIDGIDGLACCMAILYAGLPGCLFAGIGQVHAAGICFGLTGATAGLLYYNIPPARIYMGDTGSMLLGFSIFLLSVLFVNTYAAAGIAGSLPLLHTASGAMVVVVAMLLLPVFDALRVFALRMSRGISPLRADRTHLHYYLLDAGFGHAASVAIIMTATIVLIIAGWALQDVNITVAIAALAALAAVFLYLVYLLRQRRMKVLAGNSVK